MKDIKFLKEYLSRYKNSLDEDVFDSMIEMKKILLKTKKTHKKVLIAFPWMPVR